MSAYKYNCCKNILNVIRKNIFGFITIPLCQYYNLSEILRTIYVKYIFGYFFVGVVYIWIVKTDFKLGVYFWLILISCQMTSQAILDSQITKYICTCIVQWDLFISIDYVQAYWQPHNRTIARRIQNMGWRSDGGLWLLVRGGGLYLSKGTGVSFNISFNLH